jgi:hypothetical protein
VQWDCSYVQDPDEDIGTWFAEGKEYQIPEIVKDEIDQYKTNSKTPPREDGKENNVEFEYCSNDLSC